VTGPPGPGMRALISTSPPTYVRTRRRPKGLASLPAAGGECSLKLSFEFLDLARPLA